MIGLQCLLILLIVFFFTYKFLSFILASNELLKETSNIKDNALKLTEEYINNNYDDNSEYKLTMLLVINEAKTNPIYLAKECRKLAIYNFIYAFICLRC